MPAVLLVVVWVVAGCEHHVTLEQAVVLCSRRGREHNIDHQSSCTDPWLVVVLVEG